MILEYQITERFVEKTHLAFRNVLDIKATAFSVKCFSKLIIYLDFGEDHVSYLRSLQYLTVS